MEDVRAIKEADVSIAFDMQKYFPGNPMKLSASMNEGGYRSKPLHGIVVKVIVQDPALKRHSFDLYDNGHRSDPNAGDGIYTNVFDDTLDIGIYKFHILLTGHDNSANTTFTRECFIAKTVLANPLPTSTPAPGTENKSCKRIDAANPIVVRPEGMGGNDSDMYSRYAFRPKAVSTGAGILVTWYMGFDGLAPAPNAYQRLLDDNANPVGDVNLLFERNWVGEAYGLVRQGDDAVLSYCGRFHKGPYGFQEMFTDDKDMYTSALLDPYGQLISEHVLSPTNLRCAYGAQAIWTGARMLYTSGSTLHITDANGNSISSRTIHTDIGSYPSLATGHGRVLMALATKSGLLAVHRFDLEGNDLGEPAIIYPTTYEANGKIVTGYFRSPYVVPTADGWMVIAESAPAGAYIVHLAPDGSPTSSPVIIDENTQYLNSIADAIPYGGGAVYLRYLMSGYSALFISKDGVIDQQWIPQEGVQPINASLFEHQGRLYLVYTSGKTGGIHLTNQVLILELQCVPESFIQR